MAFSSWRGWMSAAVLAGAVGVGIAWWLAPSSVGVPVDMPAGTSSGASAPMPAPPALAREAGSDTPPVAAAAQPAAAAVRPPAAAVPASRVPPLPPGVTTGQWRKLESDLASQPAELARVAEYLEFADAARRLREGDAAAAARVDAALDERLRRREVTAGEARLIKIAALEQLLPDAASRQAELQRWQARVAPPPAAPDVRETDFLRRQAAVVAAWQARPESERDPQALERELDALRRSHFPTTDTGGPR